MPQEAKLSREAGPYHRGELEVQRRAGVEEDAQRVGRIITDRVPSVARDLLQHQRVAILASLDSAGGVWSSLLTGSAGFIGVVDERLLYLDATPHPGDPLTTNLSSRGELGMLVIDFSTRRRMRFNGKGMFGPGRGIFLMVDQFYGNCPKYIQARRPAPDDVPAPAARPPQRFRTLTDRHRRWIAGADTFFIASFHPEGGADASHRGGSPGFVRMLSDSTLVFPDYPGNNMFNTLGNITAYPLAGLLFVDFDRGDLLQLTGHASLVWDQETVAGYRGAQDAVVAFEVDEAVETPGGSGMRWELVESAGRVPVTVPPGRASQ